MFLIITYLTKSSFSLQFRPSSRWANYITPAVHLIKVRTSATLPVGAWIKRQLFTKKQFSHFLTVSFVCFHLTYLPTYLPLLLLVYTIIKTEHHRVAFVFTLWVRVHVCQIELKAFFCGAVWLFQGACYFSLCVIVSMWWIPAIMSQRHCTYRKTHTHTSVLDWLHLCCITRATQMITIVSLD